MSTDLQHGGALDRVAARFPSAPSPWIDLSTGINPWAWPVDRVDIDCLHRLPTYADMDRCRQAMAAAFGAPADAVALVPGTEIAIRLLPKILDVSRVVVLTPSYGDHAETWAAAGVDLVQSGEPLDHRDDANVIVVCNPNNPDGRCFDPTALKSVRERLAERGGWLIIDEAYADLDPDQSLSPMAGLPGLIVLRSTGKFFGLPGLRLGAVLGPPDVMAALNQLLGVWQISGPALAIGAVAYADTDWQEAMRRHLAEVRARVDDVLVAQGVRVTGGTDLYRYLEFEDAHAIWHQLCLRGIYTRRFEWTKHHLRMGLPPTPAAETRLMEALSLEC
ncbi:MAG: threonine-phosphate decarboxylase CobD [Pseudomonadota bacterium]